MWPGMAYYLTLFYPPESTGKRIGQYFTAAQVSAAVVGLVSAGFQRMDGVRGLTGFQWMFLVYGLAAVADGLAILWWLPDRPRVPDDAHPASGGGGSGGGAWWSRLVPRSPPALTDEDARVHYADLTRVYRGGAAWTARDLARVCADWRLWPLTAMYFGVVGVGIGVQVFATLIIRSLLPALTSVQLSLLVAPIWLCDLLAVLVVTPLSDRFHRVRPAFFIGPACVQIAGLLVVTYARHGWARYAGLLVVGLGLGPTVPVCMAWTSETFQPRHGEVGVAAATALVSGLGNLGSVTTTYALYTGWADDGRPGPAQFRKSNLVMAGILAVSIVAAVGMWVAVTVVDGNGRSRGPPVTPEGSGEVEVEEDGAQRRLRMRRRG